MASDNGAVLEAIELTKVFRGFWGHERARAVDGLNLEIRQGEVFGLLGPNGSGKTTTVRMVLGLLFPTHGAVRLFGKSPRSVAVKRRIGYMPEESHLYPYLSADETLDFFGRLFGLAGKERQRRTDALIEMVGLNRARKRPVGEYSKGMARRIGLAQSLINDPDLLILDEPTTGLDPIGSREIKDVILTLRERGKTILLCSHLLADVEEVCDRICILYGGKQRALGTVQELLVADELTEIRMPKLQGADLERVRQAIMACVGPEAAVEFSSPTRRLEEFFLEVVRVARQERLVTAGAEVGAGMAEFLGRREEEAEKVLAELIRTGDEAEPEPERPAWEPVAAVRGPQDAGFIRDLVKTGGEPTAETERAKKVQESVTAGDKARAQILDELVVREEDGKTDAQSDK